MKTYTIPDTDLQVTRLAYGCMQIGGRWDADPLTAAEHQSAGRAVMAALDAGITFFDHADIYTRGKSERVFGEILHANPGLRQKLVLQTKCGIRFDDDPQPGAPGRYDFSYAHIVRSVEGSLRRLQTETIDILLLHRPDPLVEPHEVARAFDELHKAGKVRYFGVSNHNVLQIKLLQKATTHKLVANQLELNLLHNHLINEGVVVNQNDGASALATGILDYCRQKGLLVQAWAPVANGVLFDPARQTTPAQVQTAALVAKMAIEKQTTPEAIMLAWLLRHPAGIQPIIGSTRPERIQASAQADAIELSREEWYALFVAARGASMP